MKALGMEIGSVHTSSKKVGEDIYFQNTSLMEVDLLFKKIKMEIVGKAHYRSGQLISSSSRVIANGELHNSASIEWQGNQYAVKIDGELKPALKSPIYYSGTVLYYQEPLGKNRALSESSGVEMVITPLGGGKYQVIDPVNDRKMVHFYENGVQTQVQIKHPILTVSLIRQDLSGAAR